MTRNIRLVLTYFGLPYSGWQRTALGPSVEETLERVLVSILQHPVTLQAASRTDAGVHAEGQVVNFFLQKEFPLDRLHMALNGLLPKEIVVVEIRQAAPEFHPTLDAIGKEYQYLICSMQTQLPFDRYTSWHFPYPLKIEEMQKAADALVGKRDFSAFCNELKLLNPDPVCHLEKIEVANLGKERFAITFWGDRFLYRMARNLAGTIAYAGCGKIEADQIPEILQKKDRRLAGMTAPAHGLTLKRIFYS
jgi:tRNA pseudouridine38-40 synthase